MAPRDRRPLTSVVHASARPLPRPGGLARQTAPHDCRPCAGPIVNLRRPSPSCPRVQRAPPPIEQQVAAASPPRAAAPPPRGSPRGSSIRVAAASPLRAIVLRHVISAAAPRPFPCCTTSRAAAASPLQAVEAQPAVNCRTEAVRSRPSPRLHRRSRCRCVTPSGSSERGTRSLQSP